jgi:predicted transcriptional regulator
MSSGNVKITGRQIAAARELLNITQAQLAAAVGMQHAVLGRIEVGKVEPRQSSLDRIREVLEEQGIVFINGGTPGVKLDPSKARPPEKRE